MTNAEAPCLSRTSTRQGSSSPDHHQNYHPSRAIKSCLECRRRKMRCSRIQPCQNCDRFSRDCVYLSVPVCSSSLSSDAKRDVVHRSAGTAESLPWSASESRNNGGRIRPQMTWDGPEINSDPVAKLGGFETFDTNNDNPDVGLQIGRLRICERMGGLFRSQIAKKVGVLLQISCYYVTSNSSLNIRTEC